MSSPAVQWRLPAVPGRTLAALAVLSAALVAAFVVAPPALAGIGSGGAFADRAHLVDALGTAFAGYWRSGGPELTPDLQRIVDYWAGYHVVKAVVAAILLVVLGALAVRIGRAFLGAGGRGAGTRLALAASGVLATMLAVVSGAAVMANAQGVVAPFASMFPMLLEGAADGPSADAVQQVRLRLAEAPGAGGHAPPALDVMIDGFVRYHAAEAVVASIVAFALVAISVVVWRRFARTSSTDRRARRVLASSGAFSVVLSLLVLLLVVANVSAVADPTAVFVALFDGGW